MQLRKIYEDVVNEKLIDSIASKIKQLITNHIDSDFNFTKKEREFLNKTVKKDLNVYRGIGLTNPDFFNEKEYNEVGAIEPKVETPKVLLKSINDNGFTFYSKDENVAARYSQGKLAVVFKTKLPEANIIADLENLPDLIRKTFPEQKSLNETDFVYMEKMKEVIAIKAEKCDSKIVSAIGVL